MVMLLMLVLMMARETLALNHFGVVASMLSLLPTWR